ncbi:succinate-semialdehyde dehydrogenase/glutarate-semialdehyde dehydrogenase [Actinomycetospora succinea]|uniref:Succinate-semialdehyde dehydrogenase/glutarate-semialdehyde dehydrogenase n=1 Tax=Actinomycetospora succinea TaxID=663603 RepID=A0A4R6UWV1_9PSEU|nr:NAD-dependent succinate-semialdehyde dehydrogenase [Actinomycetospora succinea]TDQ51822.1 succinate-semialdehyde dehydrogenase/glutarate-semialdehyde dehydrogenase [Actinomycetospora succinea]
MAESDRERRVIDEVTKGLIIGGSVRDATDGRTFGVEDPSTGELLCDVADASPEDGMAALDAAANAQPSWAATAPRERGEILRRAFELVTERADEIALLMTLEMGKPLAESKAEITYAAEFFRWFSEEAVRISGEWKVNANGAGRVLVTRQAIGPCLLITPWNFPLAMGTRKIGPAIAAGCTMVIKPAGLTPLTILKLADILAEAGLPDGVLNVVTTSSTGKVMEPLIRDGRIRKLSFTGSTEVGRKLIEQSAEQVLKTSMELGGNAPFVVCADADVDEAVAGAMLAKMRNIGEACTAANRFYVHADVAEEFTKKLTERMGDMKIGRGTEEGVEVGPLVEADQRDKVAELVDDAVQKGAVVRTGGEVPSGAGYFYPPTVLADVPTSARLAKEEIFGPVAPIFTFTEDDDAIRAANDTEFGLVSYLYTNDLSRAIRLSERLEAGMVGLNQGMVSNAGAPFGGVKQSGLGREGGSVGIDEYLEIKYIAMNV